MDTELWNDTRVAGEQIVFNLSLNYDGQGVGTPCFDNLTVYSCERIWFFQCESDLPGKSFHSSVMKSHWLTAICSRISKAIGGVSFAKFCGQR